MTPAGSGMMNKSVSSPDLHGLTEGVAAGHGTIISNHPAGPAATATYINGPSLPPLELPATRVISSAKTMPRDHNHRHHRHHHHHHHHHSQSPRLHQYLREFLHGYPESTTRRALSDPGGMLKFIISPEERELRRVMVSRFYHNLARSHSLHAGGEMSDDYEKWWCTTKRRTCVLVNVANVMERANEQVLPAVYKFIGGSFHATPSQLGVMTLCTAAVQALSSPLGGILGHQYNRIVVISFGCVLWGLMITLLGTTVSVSQAMAVCAVNGLGLALVIPNVQSITADYFDELDRGKAFGVLYCTSFLGGALGSIFATNLGGQVLLGLCGWRVVFFCVGAMSVLIGVCVWCGGHDPRYDPHNTRKSLEREGLEHHGLGDVWDELQGIVLIPTFLIIILQGIVGSTPWNALVFFTLYLQLLGMSNFVASSLMSLFLVSTALGGWLGGWVGDMAAERYPNHGRIFVTQFSISMGIPLSIVLMKVLPHLGGLLGVLCHAVVLVVMGSLISWAAPACNNPIFAEIVPPHLRNLIYAFDRSFEMGLAACAAPIVGVLAERVFGFKGDTSGGGQEGKDLDNARALGNALLLCMVVPWALCAAAYTGLHFTYKGDKERALLAVEPPSDDEEGWACEDGTEQAGHGRGVEGAFGGYTPPAPVDAGGPMRT